VYTISADPLVEKDDNYALQFTGMLDIDKAGEHTFYTSSDDGSRLLIDNKVIVTNDGIHGVKTGKATVNLDKGRHRIQVDYFEGGGGQLLEVGTITPDGDRIPLAPSQLYFE
jgi:hypothetical protein